MTGAKHSLAWHQGWQAHAAEKPLKSNDGWDFKKGWQQRNALMSASPQVFEEVKWLDEECRRLREDLAIERGEAQAGEIIVMRRGATYAEPGTFHIILAVDPDALDSATALKVGKFFADAKVDVLREIARRKNIA